MKQTIYCAVLQLIYYKTLIIKYNKKSVMNTELNNILYIYSATRALDNILL